MPFVYHGVPRELVGEVLYPLDQLRDALPDVHAAQAKKYAGREQVTSFRLPLIDTGFTNTVHCGPIHPYHLFDARRAAGLDPPARPEGTHFSGLFFEIPLERITVHPVLWYRWQTLWINGAPGENVPSAPPVNEFELFAPERYAPLPAVPPAHLDYLQQMKARGAPALFFVHVPHVLVGGPIDVSGLTPIAWSKPPSPG